MTSTIKQIEAFVKDSPYKEYVGFEILEIDSGKIEARVKLMPFFKRYDGVAHGGISSYLADTVMGFAALTLVDPDQTVYTAEMKISFLRPGIGDFITSKAWVLKPGKRFHFCEAEVFAEKGGKPYLVAKASATMAIAQKK